MFSYGKELSDDKEEDVPELRKDHTLRNIVAFSAIKQQMIAPGSEGLWKKDENGNIIDNRTKILYSDSKFAESSSYRILSQITARVGPTAKLAVGSGCQITTEYGVEYILTCAHNVTAYSPWNQSYQNYQSLNMYLMRQGFKSWRLLRMLDNKAIKLHPKYEGDTDGGFDIALCRKLKIQSKNKNTDSFQPFNGKADTVWAPCIPSTIRKGMSLEIAGYPAEKKFWPYTHSGVVAAVRGTKAGGYALYYDIDTTPGNSGSPVMVTDKNWIKQHVGRNGITKAIIGVHTGGCQYRGLNWGTLITPSLFQWITEKTKQDL